MDSLLGRSQFLGEAVTLFTDEKTANARNRVVEWLNELPLAEPQQKCELLAKVQEIILGSCIELLEEFLEPILTLAHNANVEVRKQVVGFIEQMCKVKIELIPQVISIISMMLRDRAPQVIKRVIQACGSIYKNGLQWICGSTEITDSAEQAWNVLSLVKAQILDQIDNDNDGIRTNALKFLEGVVVLQSYPDEDSQKKDNDFSLEDVPENLKIIRRQKLEEEALNIFDILLKFHAATHISSVNLITCTGSLCTIAKLRPSLMGPVIDAFKNLNSNLPPTLTDSQVSSVRKSLKMQLVALLKNRGSYEYQGAIRHMLLDLGSSQGEINRSIPKMDKAEQTRRQKRILENAASNLQKKMRLDTIIRQREVSSSSNDKEDQMEMEVDEDELEKQRQRSTRVNEKFLTEHLRNTDVAVNLVIEFLPQLPETVPAPFLMDYSPIRDMSIQQQVANIAKILGEQMTTKKVGPGIGAFTKELPMRPRQQQPSVEPMDTSEISDQNTDKEQFRKDEATKKLRENMERVRSEHEVIERMKIRAKTLKLQEVTKPFPRSTKDKFLLDAVKRILYAERQCLVGGVSAKRRKILTVIAATFPDNVRYFIFDFIMMDVRQRIEIAFSWLYEEYCLLQGFTRHSYVKSENRPDYAYNELLSQLIAGVRKNCELKDKILLVRRLFLEAPLLPDDALNHLVEMCFSEEFVTHGVDLLKDLTLLRPPRKNKLIRILLTFCVHENADLRERALEHVVELYHIHKILPNRIEEFALQWMTHLEKETPPPGFFGKEYGREETDAVWKEETTKTCMILLLNLLPHNPQLFLNKLCEVYTNTNADLKRTIQRFVDSTIKKIGPENAALLKLIEDCPKGAETLIIRFVHILTEGVAIPNAELMQRVRELYANKIKDVRVLIPVLSGLSKQEILQALPKLLKLNQVVVKEVFNRLLGIGPEFAHQKMAATPTDILVALHTIDTSACDLKAILKATSICLSEKDIFTQEVLIAVLQQLAEMVPIPTLLMRTVIQSLTSYPRLSNFVLNLLQRLILKQVWRQKIIWDGFLKCCQRLKPQSLPVLLHLPHPQLISALEQCPDLRLPLLEYAESIQEEPMSGVTPHVLDIISGKTVDVFVTDESGGYISIENIKKEIEDPQEITTITTQPVLPVPAPVPPPVATLVGASDSGQPLPPGED